MHILLRFTKISADGIQDDDFPKNLILKINNKVSNTFTRNGTQRRQSVLPLLA